MVKNALEINVLPEFDRGVSAKEAKSYLNRLESDLFLKHNNGTPAKDIIGVYTSAMDHLLQVLYNNAKKDVLERTGKRKIVTALVAMGGYGRRELNPHSDIDLMLLYNGRLDKAIEELSKKFMYVLWDTGLDIGFSVRSVNQCLNLIRDDHKTMTSLLDSRLLAGGRSAYDILLKRFEKMMTPRYKDRFIKEKLEESRERQAKYGGTVYILEPNIKEGKGGLRDFHTVMWVARLTKGIVNKDMLASSGLLFHDQLDKLLKSVEFLWRIRNDLHFNFKKKSDQLTFDSQERIAKLFGYKDTNSSLGVEAFMRDYYLYANRIDRYSSLVISRLIYKPKKGVSFGRGRYRTINSDFNILNGMLALKDEVDVRKVPELLIKTFECSQLYLIDIHPVTIESISGSFSIVDDGFRALPAVNKTFLRIIGRKKGLYDVLKKMHSVGFLGRYIPEFRDITCKVQHDLYHVYTVDVHSLFCREGVGTTFFRGI